MLALRPLHPMFGAEAEGVDLAGCDDDTVRAVDQAMGTYGLLVFHDVAFDDDRLARFGARFGRLQNMGGPPDAPVAVIRVSNLADDGMIRPVAEPGRRRHDSNRLWHTDSSFLWPGARYSLLHGRVVTAEGGYTEFCDTRVAWEALPPDRQAALADRHADHSMLHSWQLAGVDMPGASPATMPGVTRRLAPLHAPSGRRALMVPSHVEHVEGCAEAEGQALVDALTEVAAAPERVYRHRWRVGDLLMWDNRCMLHRVTPYDPDAPRDLRSCRVLDADDEGVPRQPLGA